MRRLPGILLLVLLVAGIPRGAGAQRAAAASADTVSLDHVEELLQGGRAEEAREALSTWWTASRPKASRRDVQRGLWLRGRLTVDPAQADLDYRRLVVEYPGGPWTAQALFRLAQGAWAVGDSAGAARQVARLAREYPGSRIRGEAEAWLAAAGPPPPPPLKMPGDTAAPAGDSAAAPTAAPRPAVVPPVRTDSAATPTARYAVQLGAFSSEARARTVVAEAQKAGFEARLVHMPGSRLVHVRVGLFDSDAQASELLKRLQDLGFTAVVVLDANREERIRR